MCMPIRSQNSTIRAVLARFALLHLIPLSCLFPSHALSALSHSSTLRRPARLCLPDFSFPHNTRRCDAHSVQRPMYQTPKTQNCDACLQLNKISSCTGPTTKTAKHNLVHGLKHASHPKQPITLVSYRLNMMDGCIET